MSSHLERELAEQPEALARLIERQRANAEEIAALFRRPDVQYILIASRGSSSNAARYAQYVLGRAHRVPVAFATPSLYTLYEQPPRLDGALVLGISQSGESPDVKAVIEEARRQGRPTVAITNDPASPLAAASDAVLPIEAGASRRWRRRRRTSTRSARSPCCSPRRPARGSASWRGTGAAGSVSSSARVSSAEALQLLDGGTVVARGVNYGTAFEIALKIRELSGLLFEAYSGADLMHGPVAAIAAGWPVFALAPSGPGAGVDGRGDRGVARRGAKLIVASDDDALLARADVAFPLLPGVPEWLSPLTTVVPGQLAAMRLARLRGIDLDRPLGLSKVTLTR